MHTHTRTTLYICIAIFILAVFPTRVSAATLTVTTPDHSIGIQEVFAVDVQLDPEGDAINGIDGVITFTPETLSFVRAEDGGSIVPLWIERPHLDGSSIALSGIIPNGFTGTIDAFDPNKDASGMIVRLIFRATNPGNAAVSASGAFTYNDGKGTTQSITPSATSFPISSTPSQHVYTTNDTIPPILIASRIRDEALFDNKFTLIFSTQDKESGTEYVEIKEGRRDWKKIQSPYLLEDQSERSTLQVRAVDYAGNTTLVTIGEDTTHATVAQYIFFALILVFGFPLMVLLYKRYAYKK